MVAEIKNLNSYVKEFGEELHKTHLAYAMDKTLAEQRAKEIIDDIIENGLEQTTVVRFPKLREQNKVSFLSLDKLTTKINRDFFIDIFEILTEPHIHQSKEINYYPIDRGIYITQFGNIYFESSKCVEILEKEKESLIKNEEYESVGDVVEKISKIKSDTNKWYYISKSGEKVYTETFYKIK